MFWVYPTSEAAEAAQRLILLLGSRAISGALGLALGPDGVVAEGHRGGQIVPAVTERWSNVMPCAEGYVIAAPTSWALPGGSAIWAVPMPGDPAVTFPALGLPAPQDMPAGSYSGGEWITAVLAGAGLPITEIADPTWPEPEGDF